MVLTQKFTGHELDDGFDLTYAGARFYDQDLGIWTSPDAARQFYSSYAYGANPVNGTDPDGNEFYVSNAGERLQGPALDYNDPSVFLGYDGPKIGAVGGNIDANFIFGNFLSQTMTAAEGMWNPFTFRDLVKSGGSWDIKSNPNYIYSSPGTSFQFGGSNMEGQDLGNFNYGAAGARLPWAWKGLLLREAGNAQMGAGTSKKEWQPHARGYRLPPYGDDPRDQNFIERGFGYGQGR